MDIEYIQISVSAYIFFIKSCIAPACFFMSSWQRTLPGGGFRRHICFCLVDKCVFFFCCISLQDLRVYGSDPSRGGGTYLLPLHLRRRPGKPPAEPWGLWVTSICMSSIWNASPPLLFYTVSELDEARGACWNLILSCCDRRPLLPSSWTAKPITGFFSVPLPSSRPPYPVTHPFFPPSTRLLPVLRKGQVVTGYYRWLQRRGGYLWIQSTATVSINHKAPHERNVIWVNYVLRSVRTQQSHSLHSRTADMKQVYICRRHTVYRDPLKG